MNDKVIIKKPKKKKAVYFRDLEKGDPFMLDDVLWIKGNFEWHNSFKVENGFRSRKFNGDKVKPVKITINVEYL